MNRAIEPRKKPRQERSREMVQRILQGAKLLLKDQGYNALTTIAIAERAGLSVGSLYQYFPNKDAIVVELVRDWHAQFRLAVATLEEAPKTSGWAVFEERLAAVLRTIAEIYRDHRDLLPALDALHANGELRRIDQEHDAAIIAQLVQLISVGNASLTPDTLQRLANILLESSHACFARAAGLDDTTFELVLQDVTTMFGALLRPYIEPGLHSLHRGKSGPSPAGV